ncbi:sugar phosphate isomerase/epimerase [Lysinibacter sp. HNR]|uniref:sugar phosphate isomerase/epimerase family protein n=1 Tax=Lysinibacter sp. HNR TaxID=3031408 RepID=UPI002435268F|nr:sugar phosphate isomerase/epimerase [Lysinibacter sp. HNR]WGD37767.1 sugar phosphate isomerase/epimerase [Lysinibacter sp. HNR]
MARPLTSIQLYTLRDHLENDLASTVAKIATIGFRAVEPYNFAVRAHELAEALTAHGLVAPSGHAPLLSSDRDEIFRAARVLGITTIIDPHVPEERWASEELIRQTAAELNAAAATGREWGIRVGYHNHWWEVATRIGDRTALEVLTDYLEPDVVLEVDTYWAAVAGADVPALLERLGSRVTLIHVKDGPATREPKDQVAVGSGVLDIEAIVRAAQHLEARVVELDATRGDMFEAVAQSFAYLQSLEQETAR